MTTGSVTLLLLLLYFRLQLVQPEVFTSIANLLILISKEAKVAKILDEAEATASVSRETLNQFASEFREHSRQAAPQSGLGLAVADHPVSAAMTLRLWARLHRLVLFESPRIARTVRRLLAKSSVDIPTHDDYRGAMKQLLKLQWIYDLVPRDLARGHVLGMTSRTRLASDDMHFLGVVAMNSRDHVAAHDWFMLALATRDGLLTKGWQRQIYSRLADIYEKVDYIEQAREAIRIALLLDPENINTQKRSQELWGQVEGNSTASSTSTNSTAGPRNLWSARTGYTFGPLCQGQGQTNDIRVTRELRCRYRPGTLPYVRYKEEIHNIDPRVSLFLDVITQSEAQTLQRVAIPLFTRAEVTDGQTKTDTNYRIGKLAWLCDDASLVQKLVRRVDDVTGLSVRHLPRFTHGEELQVLNYGIGGEYIPHMDTIPDSVNDPKAVHLHGAGDRVATFMFYLNNVTAGGATIFPELGLRILPQAGAAAFWYNMKRDGGYDPRTLHAGCPVLLGQKWVANKWIREAAQWRNRPCGLHPSDTDPL